MQLLKKFILKLFKLKTWNKLWYRYMLWCCISLWNTKITWLLKSSTRRFGVYPNTFNSCKNRNICLCVFLIVGQCSYGAWCERVLKQLTAVTLHRFSHQSDIWRCIRTDGRSSHEVDPIPASESPDLKQKPWRRTVRLELEHKHTASVLKDSSTCNSPVLNTLYIDSNKANNKWRIF